MRPALAQRPPLQAPAAKRAPATEYLERPLSVPRHKVESSGGACERCIAALLAGREANMPRPRATCSVAAELREGVKQLEPNDELEGNDGCIAAMDAGLEDDLELPSSWS